ncbi:MAG: M3 family metallopeptidase [Lentimicrobium sp.]|uniref:M3 family metallopeptidase n=1 Tax=Lentimicrobium sp. TaxID=2034841 RepID=UPI0026012007|nr:M3 family metallopeptidase [Lentimicrobium sp.]MCO5258207.1 M3 family metallopeptidase [Lentimicrobium sp.]MCO5262079.1 M3 family metallopeptidase [Lentimicrobium sp.]
MKKLTLILLLATMITACKTGGNEKSASENPFFAEYDTPFGVPPFSEIKNEHFLPAIEKGIEEQTAQIAAIVSNPEPADFENTIAAYDYSGELIRKVTGVFYNYNSSNTNAEIQALAKEIAPKLSAHYDNINLNPELFEKVRMVYENRNALNLNGEQARLLEDTYKDFVRGGAALESAAQVRFREINQELSVLTLRFGENVLAETNEFKLVIDNQDDLEGLTRGLIDQGAETAKAAGMEGKWVYTLHNPSIMPFLQYSAKRDLREKIYKAYINRGNNNNDKDNKELIGKITALRLERANLLGYETHAAFILEENMAKNAGNVLDLLNQLWTPALKRAKAEVAQLQTIIDKEGGNFKLQPWDWNYYTEKLRKEQYDLDDEQLKPYFSLENVKQGIFTVCKNLYGITFTEQKDIPVYHPDAVAYEVNEANGDHIGVLYMDFHPRESKRGGAWMSSYRKQYVKNGEKVSPVITIVCNFTKPTASQPSLLTFDETSTFFHEFGHALHGLLSNSTYYSLSGTSVPRDFVELPSQIMENWASEPEVLKLYAKHYQTGEVIPDELIDKIQNSAYFNQGFATVEYLAASFLDMGYHNMKEFNLTDVSSFEDATLAQIGLIPEITSRYRSTYFNHIFSGGYSSGYYSYIWSGILDSDAFEAFKEHGLFDQATAASFRKNILERGGTEDPMVLYKKFRGAEPDIKPLLKRRGLLES